MMTRELTKEASELLSQLQMRDGAVVPAFSIPKEWQQPMEELHKAGIVDKSRMGYSLKEDL